MASGCLIDTCPIRTDLIWEDEWDLVDDTFIHDRCKGRYIKQKFGMKEEQFLRLCGVSELRKEITATVQSLNDSTEFYMEKLQLLESKLDNIVKNVQ